MFERMMVGVGHPGLEAGLLRYARMLMERISPAEIHFVHVLGPPTLTPGSAFVSYDAARRELENAVARHFSDTGGRAVVRTRVLSGIRVDQLLEFAAENSCDLILVGHGRATGGRRSLARRLAMQAPCSLWMAPEGSEPQIGAVLAAIDFSEPSALALCAATFIAARGDHSECVALHVNSNDSRGRENDGLAGACGADALARFIAPLDPHGILVQPEFEESPGVASGIDRAARRHNASLIVLGTRGQTESVAILLGSESEQVLMESRVPVLVVKQRGERLGLLRILLDRDFAAPRVSSLG